MELHDHLKICLLAVASRYPDHIMDIDEAVLGITCPEAHDCTATELIERLESSGSETLLSMAHLVINPNKTEIYLVDLSESHPAILIHCHGQRFELQEAPVEEKVQRR